MMGWKDAAGHWHSWWIGYEESDFDRQRVVEAQFDGHELEVLRSAMRNAYLESNGRVGMNGESHP